ncbi:tyrosine-type recombinase/integrase [Mycolicibacterium sp. P1-18]|uniref:tyrosine-type recombinase/integrase n=1 Tax=Mycolicibacterium sp. P1-18 TaxID=2024615 RepID=UPI001F5B8660|nr:tyrosine-type recombinase/integrase [Mycolicibacterium sp. P1-18]
MTIAAHRAAAAETDADGATSAELWNAVSQLFLTSVNWSGDDRVLWFPRDHAVLGWRECVVPDCDQKMLISEGLCAACNLRWKQLELHPLADFVQVPRVRHRRFSDDPCGVKTCERTARTGTGLCGAHERARKRRHMAVEDFINQPDLDVVVTFGECGVGACTRERVSSSNSYCPAHAARWREYVGGTAISVSDEEKFRRIQPAITVRGEVTLRGLPDRVVAELLYGLQQHVAEGVRLDVSHFRMLARQLRSQQVATIDDADAGQLTYEVAKLHRKFVTSARRWRTTPEMEAAKDVWDLAVFGHPGTLRFGSISQSWLRAAAKVEVYNDLPRRRGKGGKSQCQTRINYLVLLSESLHLQRGDSGDDLHLLSRSDITAFLNRMAFLESGGQITGKLRARAVRELRRTLNQMRAIGVTRIGQPLHGLPDDFSIAEGDIPDEPDEQAAGRDLPVEVVRHLCQHLDGLEVQAGTEVRVAVELMIDTGRRPEEICELAFDCISRDGGGDAVLIYDNRKANRLQRRLPIGAATLAVIERQQQRVRQRFPDTPAGELKLLPTSIKNPYGAKGMRDETVGARHRKWVDSLPEVLVPKVTTIDGKAPEPMPFDKSRMFPYAYRHTYAQRHADAGVPVDVLRELMDHLNLVTTQGYYRVGEQRRRNAVDRVTAMQFDRHGNRTWSIAKKLLDSEHLRRAVGEVAVPYGMCSEPANVAAGGNDCPVRFRCVGCAHFSTDVSYLPDLEGYLASLLRTREKLLSFLDADEWARSEALPSDEEVTRIRRLIARIKADVDDLSEADRTQIEEAVGVVRRARNGVVRLNMPSVRQPPSTIRPDRTA